MISIIVPTYNESQNIASLIPAIRKSMEASHITDFEVLVMDDDSPDGTAQVVEGMKDDKTRVVVRRGKLKGLSAAVIDGFAEARGDVLGVMDADLSHPPEKLPELYRAVESGANIAIGSRYVKGGAIANWPFKRRLISHVACWLAKPVTRVKDATSGFFLFKKEVLQGVSLDPLGFKIGLEVFTKTHHNNKIKEVPYTFKDREKGESKLGANIIGCYLKQLWKLMWRR